MIARFDWIDAKSVDEVVAQLGNGKKVMLKAGGVDVVDRLKEGLDSPERLVNIHNVAGLNRVEDVAVLVVELQTCVESWTDIAKRQDGTV